jgi:hypothetical protein
VVVVVTVVVVTPPHALKRPVRPQRSTSIAGAVPEDIAMRSRRLLPDGTVNVSA